MTKKKYKVARFIIDYAHIPCGVAMGFVVLEDPHLALTFFSLAVGFTALKMCLKIVDILEEIR